MCSFESDNLGGDEEGNTDLFAADVQALARLPHLAHLNLGSVAANDEMLQVGMQGRALFYAGFLASVA